MPLSTPPTRRLLLAALCLPLVARADEADMPPPVKKAPKKRRADPATLPTRSEEAEIESVLRELAYVRERVQSLERKYATRKAKIRFNYPALVAQLRTTEADIADFLNARIDVITTRPPTPRQNTLFFVRPN